MEAQELKNLKAEKRQKRRRRTKRIIKRIIILVIVLAILAGGGLYVYTGLKAEYTVTYQPYTAAIGTISNSLSFSGSLQLRYSETQTASSSTTVRTIYVKEGDDVKDGDKLMRLANGSIITSSIDGRVNQIKVSEGDSVSAGTTLVQVADFTHMSVSIRVDEYDISDVAVGDECRVTTTATEQTFTTSISSINYISSSAGSVAYYTAMAYVDVSDGVYPGMQVTVTVPQEEAANAVILKEDALSFDDNNRVFVYTLDESGNPVETYVETGISNGNYVEIVSGISAGDTVYVITENETQASGFASMLSGLFGGNSIQGGGGRSATGGGRSSDAGSFDMSNFDASSFSSGRSGGGSGGGGSMPSMGGGMP